MPLVYTNGRRIFFAHVPKTGGSSVEDYLLRRFSDISLFRAEKRPLQRGVLPPPQHLTAEDLANLLPKQLDYSFATVRDPLKRIVSEYKYQAGATRVSKISFANWLRVVLFTTALDPRSYDNHIRPQSDLVPDGAEIFRLENGLESIIPRLDEVTGSTAPDVAMGHLLKRDKQKPFNISRQDAALIADFYAADFRRFGYEPPSGEGLPDDPFAHLRSAAAHVIARALVTKNRRDWVR